MAQGGGKGVPENQHNYETVRNVNAKNQHDFLFLIMGRISQNLEGLSAWRLLWYSKKQNDKHVI